MRWDAAPVLRETIKQKAAVDGTLVPAARKIPEKEEMESIRKIYPRALRSLQG